MSGVLRLRSGKPLRGDLHVRLHRALKAAYDSKVCTQESLAIAIGKSQVTVGQYLRSERAGALDLDEASAALHHIGSSLMEFLRGAPPHPLSPTEVLCRDLESRPELLSLLKDLLPVPKPKLGALLTAVRVLIPLATGRRSGPASAQPDGSPSGPPHPRRTKRVTNRHRWDRL